MNPSMDNIEKSNGRLASIDQYRGFAILLMVLADYLSRIERVPAFLKHAPGVGLTVIDLIAPMFIFAIALVFKPSFQRRRARDGHKHTMMHFIRRFLALIGIGALTPWGYTWGLFQTIGGAGLLTLLVIGLPWMSRLLIGGLLLGGYQYLSDQIWMGRVTATSAWCEIEGTLSWAAMLVLATVLADWYYNPKRGSRWLVLGSVTSLGVGMSLIHWIQVSQYFVSASYVLISLGSSGMLFAGFHWLIETQNVQIPCLISWGKNPLVLYLLHYWIWVFVFVRPNSSGWHAQAPLWLIILQAGGFVGLLSLVARTMDRKGWLISL